MLNFRNSLYISDTILSSYVFAHIFYHSVPFICVTVSFTEQTFLILVNSNILIFFHGSFISGCNKNSSPNPRSSRFFVFFLFLSFIVECYIFWSMIHFELLFLKGVRSASRLIFCTWVSSFNTICVEETYPTSLSCFFVKG